MASIQPYLIFSGNCEEAVNFYCQVFDGKVGETSRYKDAQGMDVPANWKEKIIHTSFTVRGDRLLASDAHPGQPTNFGNSIHLSVNFEKTEDMKPMFEKLSQGGKVTMPMQKTFWDANFGMLTDRFGVNWMFNQHLS